MNSPRFLAALFLAALAVSGPAFAQAPAAPATGKVTGRLVAEGTGEPLGFADVALLPAGAAGAKPIGTMTNADGTFRLDAPAGTYTLNARAISYASKSVVGVVVKAGATKELSIALASDAIQQETVVVEGKLEVGTEAAMLNRKKKSSSVGDVVSAEEVRRSPDRDAGDVLKRVTGTSLQEGKFVFVRGMGERYSSTEMDGVRIASPEQNKRVVPLDMIPSGLLENIVVQKTYTADRPGEFGGGDVQITTKDFPGKRMLQVSLGAGYDDATSFGSIMGREGERGDNWAAGASARELPPELAELAGHKKLTNSVERAPYDTMATIGSSFKNELTPVSVHNVIPGNFLVSYGDILPMLGTKFGVIASVGANHSDSRTTGDERLYEGSADALQYDYASETDTRSAQFSVLAGLSYRLGTNGTISLRGNQNRSADDESRSYFGINTSQSSNFQVTRLRYLERVIGSLALDGRHEFPGFHRAKLSWTASLTNATRKEPDRREVYYRQNLDENNVPTEPLYFYRTSRDWGDLKDEGKGLSARFTLPVKPDLLDGREAKLDVGGSFQHKDRNSTYRRFDFGNNAFDIDPTAPAESLFQDGEWISNGFPRAYVSENTQPEDSYRAKQGVDGAFLSADVPATHALRAILGARVEHGTQDAVTYDLFTTATVAEAKLDDWDVLPTANLVYALDERTNIRLAAARTLSRPDLRELTPGRTLNFFSGYQDIGNPNLQRATIWNYDLRFETYPGGNETLAIGGFYKNFYQPIEKQIVTGGSDRLLQPQNSDKGRNYGLEIETRMGLGRIDPRLKGLFVNANGSLISSKITLKDQLTLTTSPEHPLQGQANYLVNAGIGWAVATRFDATFLVSAVGRRLYALGIQPVARDIYDEPTTTLDAVVNWSPQPHWRIKAAAKNLTNVREDRTQGNLIVETRDSSRTFGLSVAWNQ